MIDTVNRHYLFERSLDFLLENSSKSYLTYGVEDTKEKIQNTPNKGGLV